MLKIKYESRDELFRKHPKIEICLKCGNCCAIVGHSCHVMYNKSKFDPKNTYVYDIFAAKEPTKNPNLWLCVSCHKCHEICPYDVDPIGVIEALKEASFEQGYAHNLIQDEVNQILSTGAAFPISPTTKRLRESLRLPPFEKIDISDLVKIAEGTGLERKLIKLRAKEG